MDLSELWTDAKRAAQVLSNPSQSSILASGAAASLSAELSTLEHQASLDLTTFGAKLPAPIQNALAPYLNIGRDTLAQIQAPAGVIPSGRIFGLTYLQAGLAAAALFFGLIFFVARAAR